MVRIPERIQRTTHNLLVMINDEKDMFAFYADNKLVERITGYKEAYERFKAYISTKFDGTVTVVREGKFYDRVEWVY